MELWNDITLKMRWVLQSSGPKSGGQCSILRKESSPNHRILHAVPENLCILSVSLDPVERQKDFSEEADQANGHDLQNC